MVRGTILLFDACGEMNNEVDREAGWWVRDQAKRLLRNHHHLEPHSPRPRQKSIKGIAADEEGVKFIHYINSITFSFLLIQDLRENTLIQDDHKDQDEPGVRVWLLPDPDGGSEQLSQDAGVMHEEDESEKMRGTRLACKWYLMIEDHCHLLMHDCCPIPAIFFPFFFLEQGITVREQDCYSGSDSQQVSSNVLKEVSL